jgi:hypothetical protein
MGLEFRKSFPGKALRISSAESIVTKRVALGELSVFLRENKTQQSTENAESHPSRRFLFFPVFSPVSNRSSPPQRLSVRRTDFRGSIATRRFSTDTPKITAPTLGVSAEHASQSSQPGLTRGVLGDLKHRLAGQRHVGSAAPFSWHLLTNVCLRSVRPVLSAWHEMPGQAARRRFALQGQFSAERCVFGVTRVCGSGLCGAVDLAGARAFRVEHRGLWTHPWHDRAALTSSSVFLCASVFQNPSSSTRASEGRCRGRI